MRNSLAGKSKPARPSDTAAERKAAVAHEREEKRRVRERALQEAAQREHQRRQAAIEKPQVALDAAEREYLGHPPATASDPTLDTTSQI